MQAKGMKSITRIGFEDTYGVAQTTAAEVFRIPFNSNSLKATQNIGTPETITGYRNPVEPYDGQKDVSGNIVMPLDARNFGLMLKGLFGAPTTTVLESNKKNQHVFKVSDAQPSMTIEKEFSDIQKIEQFTGCKISKMEIDAEVGNNETTVQMEFMGKDGAPAKTSIGTAAKMLDITRFNNTNATVKMDGEAVASARKMTLSIDGGLGGDTFCLNGTASRTDIAEGIMSVTGAVTLLFQNMDAMQKAIDGVYSSLELVFTNKAGDSLSFLMPKVKFEKTSPEISGPKGITLEMNYHTFSANAADSAITVTLINDVTAY